MLPERDLNESNPVHDTCSLINEGFVLHFFDYRQKRQTEHLEVSEELRGKGDQDTEKLISELPMFHKYGQVIFRVSRLGSQSNFYF